MALFKVLNNRGVRLAGDMVFSKEQKGVTLCGLDGLEIRRLDWTRRDRPHLVQCQVSCLGNYSGS